MWFAGMIPRPFRNDADATNDLCGAGFREAAGADRAGMARAGNDLDIGAAARIRAAEQKAGAAAIEMVVDQETGVIDSARIIDRYGAVPDHLDATWGGM